MSIKKEKFKVYDMTCGSCETRVEKSIKKLDGVFNAIASFEQGTVLVEYETELCSADRIKAAVKTAGYSTENTGDIKLIGIIVIVAAIIILGMFRGGIDMESKLKGASYLMLFVIGMFTSIHCVGMCGGLMLTQSVNRETADGSSNASAKTQSKFEAIKPALLYNTGRVISYTIIGGIIGALGSVMSLSTTTMAILQLFAGLFMVVMGFNLAGFSIFRKLNLKLPWSSCGMKKKPHTPLIVGLLNGLMPCGPLQTMQIYALGAGSAFAGALSMFMFSIGTVPLMLAFGAASGLLSKGYTKKILKFSGILVIVLGLIMSSRGLSLAGINLNPMRAMMSKNLTSSTNAAENNVVKPEIKDGVQIVRMTADASGYNPRVLYIQKGMPVKWIIDGKQITSCNNQIVVPTYKIKQKLKSGETVIEFTPKDDKDINFSCWMGMITGVFKVVDNFDSIDASKTTEAAPPAPSGGSCCGGSGDTTSAQASIYGDDLSKVPTATLIKKVNVSNSNQTLSIQGIGYEFSPLVIVTGKDINTKLTIDLNKFDNPEGTFTVMDINTGDKITTFEGKKGSIIFEYTFKKNTGYAIIKDNIPLAIIDVVDNVKTADLEQSRSKYLK